MIKYESAEERIVMWQGLLTILSGPDELKEWNCFKDLYVVLKYFKVQKVVLNVGVEVGIKTLRTVLWNVSLLNISQKALCKSVKTSVDDSLNVVAG